MWILLVTVCLAVSVGAQEDRERTVIRAQVEGLCNSRGHADKVDEITDAGMRYSNCLKNLIEKDVTNLYRKNARGELSSDDVTVQMYQIICAKSSGVKTCSHPYVDALTQCFSEDLYNRNGTATIAIGFLDKSTDYFCDNNAFHSTELVRAGLLDCVRRRANEMQQCLSELQSTRALDFQNECTIYNAASRCIVDKARSCSMTLGRLAASALHTIVPCDRNEAESNGRRPDETSTNSHSDSRTGSYYNTESRTGSYDRPESRTGSYDNTESRTGSYYRLESRTGSYDNTESRTGSYRPESRTGSYDNMESRTGSYYNTESRTVSYDRPESRTGATAQEDRERTVIRAQVEGLCNSRGHADKVDEITDAGMRYSNCLKNLIEKDVTNLYRKKARGELSSSDYANQMFQIICAKSSGVKACSHPYVDALTQCFAADLYTRNGTATIAIGFLDNTMNYFCENNAFHSTELVRAGLMDCVRRRANEMQQCLSELQSTRALDFQNECTIYNAASRCIVDKARSCSMSLGRLTASALHTIVPCDGNEAESNSRRPDETSTNSHSDSKTGSYYNTESRTGSYDRPESRTGSYDNTESRTGSYYRPESRTGSYDNTESRTGSYYRPESRTGSY